MSLFTCLTSLPRGVRRLAAASALVLLGAGAAHAQVVPRYGFSVSSRAYVPLTGATTFLPDGGRGSLDDGHSLPQTIPFPFQFGFNTFTQYTVGTNGYIVLGTVGSVGRSLPLNTAVNQMIGFFAKDLRANQGPFPTVLSAVTTGTAPNRIHKIELLHFTQWNNVTADGSAQVWLFENGDIELHYGDFNTAWSNGSTGAAAGAQAGLRGTSVTDALTLTGTWRVPVETYTAAAVLPSTGSTGDIPTTGDIFRFTLPGGDLTPPDLGRLTITPAGGACLPTAHTVSVTPTDASGLASVTLLYTVQGGTQQQVPMVNAGGTYSATIPAQGSDGVRYSVQVVDAGNNTLTTSSAPAAYRDGGLAVSVSPRLDTAYVGERDTLTASASLGGTVRITEFTLYRFGRGATAPYPPYIVSGMADFVELSNLGTGPVDISSYGFEVQGGNAARTYTFPAATVIPGRGVLVLHIGTGTDDVANNFYNTGGLNDRMFSGNDQGFVLTSATGQVVDAVLTNGFAPALPVIATDWTGAVGVTSPRTIAGAGLYGPDLNDSTNWADAARAPQSIGTLNPGLPIVSSGGGVQWTGPGLPNPVAGTRLITPVFTAPGTFRYVAATSNATCTATDTATIIVLQPQVPITAFSADNLAPRRNSVVTLTDQSRNRPTRWRWRISPAAGALFYDPTHSDSAGVAYVIFSRNGTYTVTLTVSNVAGQDSLTKTGYIVVGNPRYCDVTGSDCATAYIDAVVIPNTSLRNRRTGCNNITTGYATYPLRDSTTAQLRMGQRYDLRVTSSSAGAIAAWIDYNNNNRFDTAEYIRVLIGPNPTPGQSVTVNFLVPSDTIRMPTGVPIGLRIRSRQAIDTTYNNEACRRTLDGETEDYLITLLKPLPPIVIGTAADRVSALAVYPNPSTGRFRVELTGTGARRIELRVTDALGRVVHTQRAADNTTADLDLHHLSAGVYFLHISLDGQTGFRRIEIQP